MVHLRNIIFVIINCAIAALFAVSCGEVGWYVMKVKKNGQTGEASIGLWKSCVSVASVKVCFDLPEEALSDSMEAIRGCSVIATGISIVVLLFACTATAVSERKVKYAGYGMLLACTLSVAAGVLFFEEMSDYDLDFDDHHYGWAYILNWIGAGSALVSVFFACYLSAADEDYDLERTISNTITNYDRLNTA
uniref:Uncharacterized protein n=1 Tax=Clytia hemisphaerica TaxID=252671 RepID=A0A7M5XLR3_9CNID